MFAKNDLNSVALNMSIVRLQLNSLMTMDWIDTEIFKSWHKQWKDHPLHLRRCLLHIHLFIFFKLLNLYAKFLYLKMTWGGEKIGCFYCWFLFHSAYQRNFLLEKVKNYFPRAKLQRIAAFTQLPIGLESEVKGVTDLVCWKAYYLEGNHG